MVKESRDCGKFGDRTPRLLPLTNGAHQSELPAERPPQHATIPSMAEFRFRLNPRAGELPQCSAVLNGRGTRYEVNDYRTTCRSNPWCAERRAITPRRGTTCSPRIRS